MQARKLDDIKLGILIGTIMPMIGVAIYYFIHQAIPNERIDGMSFQDYIDMLARPRILAAVLRGALIMNLGAFFLALNFDMNKVSKGIIIMTVVYGALIFYLHFPKLQV